MIPICTGDVCVKDVLERVIGGDRALGDTNDTVHMTGTRLKYAMPMLVGCQIGYVPHFKRERCLPCSSPVAGSGPTTG